MLLFGKLQEDILPNVSCVNHEIPSLTKSWWLTDMYKNHRAHHMHSMHKSRDWLDHSKELATPFGMDKYGPVWVHTHHSYIGIDSHACANVTSTRMQAHRNISYRWWQSFKKTSHDHWIVDPQKVLKGAKVKIEDESHVGLERKNKEKYK